MYGNGMDREKIRLARESKGLTQKAAAELVGRGYLQWWKWESGRCAMPPELWELFCLKTGLAESPIPPA